MKTGCDNSSHNWALENADPLLGGQLVIFMELDCWPRGQQLHLPQPTQDLYCSLKTKLGQAFGLAVETMFGTPISHAAMHMFKSLFWLLVLPSFWCIPSEGSRDGSSAWVPTTNMGRQDGISGFWLQPGPGLAVIGIWSGKLMDAGSLSLLLSLSFLN